MAMINCQNCEKEISDYFSAVEMYFKKYGSIDVNKYFEKYGSYYAFLIKYYSGEYKIRLSVSA